MEAKLKSINRIQLLTAEEAIGRILGGIDSPGLKNELSKWLEFGMNGNGKSLHTLSPEQLAMFMDKLPDLVLALYNAQKDQQKGGDR